jgi:hypothetical protein
MPQTVLAQVTPREVGDVRGLENSGRNNLEGYSTPNVGWRRLVYKGW